MVVLFAGAGFTIIATIFVARRNRAQAMRFYQLAEAKSRVVPRPNVG